MTPKEFDNHQFRSTDKFIYRDYICDLRSVNFEERILELVEEPEGESLFHHVRCENCELYDPKKDV